MNAVIDSERVKDAVSVGDIIERYHICGSREGRTNCPFHGGINDNLGYNSKVWHCFVCGAKGDVIDFVMQLFTLDFSNAIEKIARDFNIPLKCKTVNIRQLHKIKLQDAERKLAKLKIKHMHEKLKSEYWNAFDEYTQIDQNFRNYAPETSDGTLHPLFIHALQNIGYATYRLLEADEQLNEFERDNRHT